MTTLARAKSTTLTAGLGNPILSTFEALGAVMVAVLALVSPLIALALVVGVCWLIVRVVRRHLRRNQGPAAN